MRFNEVIEQILLSRPDLTRNEVLEMIEKKKRRADGFFTSEAAARLVALELGLEVPYEPFQPEVRVRDLVSGLNDVSIIGRVTAIYPPRAFTRSDWTEGKVAHLLIMDDTGTLKVVLWDERTTLIEAGEVKQGQIAKISHGYVREGRNGRLEVHVGLRGDLQVFSSNSPETTHESSKGFHKEL